MNRPTMASLLSLRRAGVALTLALAFAVTVASAGSTDPLAAPQESESAIATEAESFTPASTDDVSTAIDLDLSDVVPASPMARPMRGYCRCTCSLTPNCSTNADCGGSLCLKGPTCC